MGVVMHIDSKIYSVHWQSEYDGKPRFRNFDEEEFENAFSLASKEVIYLNSRETTFIIEPHIDIKFKYDAVNGRKIV